MRARRRGDAPGGQGLYLVEFSHYEQVPPLIQQQLVDKYKPREEE